MTSAIRRLVADGPRFLDVLAFGMGVVAGSVAFASLIVDGGQTRWLGWLAAVIGGTHLASRWTVLPFARRWSYQGAMDAAVLVQAAGFLLAVVSDAIVVLFAAALLQGWARGWYWTASQAKAAEVDDGGHGVAVLTLMSSLASVLGPIALFVLTGFRSVLVAAALMTLLALRPAPRSVPAPMARADRDRVGGRGWGASVGVGFSALSGVLNSITLTFVPAFALQLGLGPDGVGALVLVASVVGLAAVVAVAAGGIGPTGIGWPVVTGLALGALLVHTWTRSTLTLVAVALLAAAASEVLRTLAPIKVATRLPLEGRAHGMLLTGTARSVSLFAYPSLVGLATGPLGVVGAVAVSAVASAALTLAVERRADVDLGSDPARGPVSESRAGCEPPAP